MLRLAEIWLRRNLYTQPASKIDMNEEAVKQALPAFQLELETEGVGTPQPGDKPARRLRAGDLCPNCKSERLDYDGLLNLACPNCGYALNGCFT